MPCVAFISGTDQNPINPDLELWAVPERMQRLVSPTRYDPPRFFFLWQYRIPQRTDVATAHRNEKAFSRHAADLRPLAHLWQQNMLQSVAQKSIDLDFDGLMIESHIDPDNAWSDAKQQVTPGGCSKCSKSFVEE